MFEYKKNRKSQYKTLKIIENHNDKTLKIYWLHQKSELGRRSRSWNGADGVLCVLCVGFCVCSLYLMFHSNVSFQSGWNVEYLQQFLPPSIIYLCIHNRYSLYLFWNYSTHFVYLMFNISVCIQSVENVCWRSHRDHTQC